MRLNTKRARFARSMNAIGVLSSIQHIHVRSFGFKSNRSAMKIQFVRVFYTENLYWKQYFSRNMCLVCMLFLVASGGLILEISSCESH